MYTFKSILKVQIITYIYTIYIIISQDKFIMSLACYLN